MKAFINNVPLFPISIFLLPGGITRLRIFEQRYLKMVSIASEGIGFVISSPIKEDTDKKGDAHWGSWVHIINFDQGEDGVLEIDVKCTALVELPIIDGDQHSKEDTLKFCDIRKFSHWSEKKSNGQLSHLSQSLNLLFDDNNLLNDLYQHHKQDSSYWLVARWLELLPIPFNIKSQFVKTYSYREAKQLINSILSNDAIVIN